MTLQRTLTMNDALSQGVEQLRDKPHSFIIIDGRTAHLYYFDSGEDRFHYTASYDLDRFENLRMEKSGRKEEIL